MLTLRMKRGRIEGLPTGFGYVGDLGARNRMGEVILDP